ncbi:vWA domain-containing protein [Thermocladium modestius]|uniref:vWA domain-containing protein n=1 Tax=Thermocladium modestius TaxID=62609 RepID=UPI001E5EDE60|nr:VWA domain-containing protein [Thermocladium modestius]
MYPDYVSQVLDKVYEYLSRDGRVVRPGSVRGFQSAVNDIVMRMMLSRNYDVKTMITRIGIENLFTSVETANPDDKIHVLEEAFQYAFNSMEQHEEEEAAEGLESDAGSGEGGKGKDNGNDEAKKELAPTNVESMGSVVTIDGSNNMVSAIYEALYGSVGTANFLNLAQLLNMFVDPMANITEKLKAVEKLSPYLTTYGLLSPQDKGKKADSLDSLRSKSRGPSSPASVVRVVKFTETTSYPTYVVSMREYKFGDGISSIDFDKTALNVSKKVMMGKPITQRDIIVKEYADIKMLDIVLCLDVSGSMRELSDGVTKIDIARDAISRYITFLSKTSDRLAMILFNFRADVLWKLHPVSKYRREMLEITKYIYAGGGTNISNALEKSMDVVAGMSGASRHLICVTDGRTVNAAKAIKDAVKLRRMGTTISTIAIGNNSDDDLLLRISKLGNGLYIKIGSMRDLDRALLMDKMMMH